MTAPQRLWYCPGCGHPVLRDQALVNLHVAGCEDARRRFDANVLRDVFEIDAEAAAVFVTEGNR